MASPFGGPIDFLRSGIGFLDPRTSALPNGGFMAVVASTDVSGQGIHLLRFDGDGVQPFDPAGVRLANVTTELNQYQPHVALLKGGRYVVTYRSDKQDAGADVYGRIFPADGGVGFPEFTPYTRPFETSVNETNWDLLELANGNWASVYTIDKGVQQKLGLTIGDPSGGYREFTVWQHNRGPLGYNGSVAGDASLAQMPDGRIVVMYNDPDDKANPIKYRIYSADGTTATAGIAVLQTQFSVMEKPNVAALENGNVVVAFYVQREDGRKGIWVQCPEGPQKFAAFEVSATGHSTRPDVTALPGGNFVVSWQDGNKVKARVVGPTGSTQGPVFDVNEGQPSVVSGISATALRDGRFVISWSEIDVGTPSAKARIYDARTGSVVVEGTSDNDIYAGTIHYGDVLRGHGGDDRLIDGSNVAEPDEGDVFNGGEADDTVSYNRSVVGLTVSLANRELNTAAAKNDIFLSIERLEGSNLSDRLDGDDKSNTLTGGAGNDVLYGGAGTAKDVFVGGADYDTVTYEFSTAGTGVRIELPNTRISTGEAQNDSYTGIEAFVGTRWSDRMVAGTVDVVFYGGQGDDEIHGNSANDRLFGQFDNDTIRGNGGRDFVDGGDGNDVLFGDGGMDTLIGGNNDDVLQGGADADTLDGGAHIVGDFASYSEASSAVTADLVTGGTQGDAAGDSYTGIEGLIGSDYGDELRGNDLANTIRGGIGNDTLKGGDGNDTLQGGVGGDTLYGGDGIDWADYSSAAVHDGDKGVMVNLRWKNNGGEAVGDDWESIENVRGSAFSDILIGNEVANRLEGGSRNDYLYGGQGEVADTLDGGQDVDGFDIDYATYEFSTAEVGITLYVENDRRFDNTGEAWGDVFIGIEAFTGTLWADRFIGDAGTNRFYGGDGSDTLSGLAGDDLLFGQDGDDILIGGLGNDRLEGSHGRDTASYENATQAVTADLSYSRSENRGEAENDIYDSIENLRGSSHADFLYGNEAENRLEGGEGADELTGRGGTDTLVGGNGNDTYAVGNPEDVIDEGNGTDSGQDQVFVTAAGKYVGAANVEIMSAVLGLDDVWLVANTTGMRLMGNEKNNTLEGGRGLDTFAGGGGSDTYYVGTGDIVIEGDNEGPADRVIARGLFTLQDDVHVEELQAAVGSYAVSLIGNNKGNLLIGNAGANYLDGGVGAPDQFEGGDGDDVYVFRNAGDDLAVNDTGGDDDVAYIFSANFTGGLAEANLFAESLKARGINHVLIDEPPPLPPPPEGANRAPGAPSLSGGANNDGTVTENADNTVVVGVLSATDPDDDPVTYVLEGNANGRFQLVGNEIRVNGAIDYEAQDLQTEAGTGLKYYEIVVRATDGNLSSPPTPIKVYVNNGNDAPPAPNKAVAISPRTLTGVVVATFALTDSEGDAITYRFQNALDGSNGLISADQRFRIEGNRIVVNGPVVVAGGETVVDYTILANDGRNLPNSERPGTLRVTATSGNAAPPAPDATIDIDEGARAGAVVAEFDPADTEGDPISYRFEKAMEGSNGLISEDGRYRIDGHRIVVNNPAEVQATATVDYTVIANDSMGALNSQVTGTVRVTVRDVSAPQELTLIDNQTVLEHASAGAAVGRLLSVNDATGETFTYQFATGGDADGRFAIGANNILRVRDGLKIDFEQQRVWEIELLVTSSVRGTFSKKFDISVRNRSEEEVTGSDGADVIVSGDGFDVLDGGVGNDVLQSGLGSDLLTGGAGADTFVFDRLAFEEGNMDTIVDFAIEEDRIHIVQAEFGSLANLGQLSDLEFSIGEAATTAEHRIIYNSTTGKLYYDADGVDGENALEIAEFLELNGLRPILRADHFIVI